jgi:alpha-L-rhamnosidase
VEGAVLEVVSGAAFDSAAGFRYITRGTADRYEAADPAGGRFALLSIRGTGTTWLLKASVRERLRPRPSGPFLQCSDAVMHGRDLRRRWCGRST